jgi:argininosuccinate lyase
MRDRVVLEDGVSFPGTSYAESVLKPVFGDQRDHLFQAMMQVHRAHVCMLEETTIISRGEAAGGPYTSGG